jgi:hypothetical protein
MNPVLVEQTAVPVLHVFYIYCQGVIVGDTFDLVFIVDVPRFQGSKVVTYLPGPGT